MRYHHLATLGCLVLLVGCGGMAGGNSDASHATESTDMATSEAALAAASASSADGASGSAEQVAEAAAAHAGEIYSPSDCVTAAQEGDTVTYELDHCTGPFGHATATGTVVAVYRIPSDGDIGAELTSDDLQVNRATIDLDTDAVYTKSGDQKTLEVQTTSSGTTGDGRTLVREGDYTTRWTTGEPCLTLSGNWSTTVGRRSWDTAVDGFSKCEDECPTGGTVEWTRKRDGKSLTVEFDGSAEARWEASGGRSGTTSLRCGR